MSDQERDKYLNFLKESLTTNVVPDEYIGMQSPNRAWQGESPKPVVSDKEDETLNVVVDKILKKEPPDDGTKDPTREYDHKIKEEIEEDVDLNEDDEDCPDCPDKDFIYEQLGISPLELLEDGENEDDEAEDLKEEKHGKGKNPASDSKKVDEGKDSSDSYKDDGANEDSSDSYEDDFKMSEQETKVIEQLIREMGLIESEADENLNEDEYLDEGDDDLLDDIIPHIED